MTPSKQRKFTVNCVLKNIKGSLFCVIKVRQYTLANMKYIQMASALLPRKYNLKGLFIWKF